MFFTSFANILFRAFILVLLWNILKNSSPDFIVPPIINTATVLFFGIIAGLADIGNPK